MIYKIGAKVEKLEVQVIQSKRKGGYFFLTCWVWCEYLNKLTKYPFCSYISADVSNRRYTWN